MTNQGLAAKKTKLERRASATHRQIRLHHDGVYQVIVGRYTDDTTPAATARTLEAALRLAAKK